MFRALPLVYHRAPLTLPPANREGPISLADYRGKQAVLVGLFRGIECPFCRRQIVQFGLMHEKLLSAGIETLAIVAVMQGGEDGAVAPGLSPTGGEGPGGRRA